MNIQSIKKEINLRNKHRFKGYNLFLQNLLTNIDKIKNNHTKQSCKKIVKYLTRFQKKKLENFHIIRVSYYSLKFANKKDKAQICKLALAHNIYEKKNNSKILKKMFDKKTLNLARILKVNRKKQWEQKYIKEYYINLNKTNRLLRIVKCLDKFDNLFNLQKNPNLDIKELYLKEIDKYILPLVKKNLPKLFNYYKKLFEYNLRLIR